ncbi:UNVERIFIED_CONTAM: Trissin [Trichonephila clavipes]
MALDKLQRHIADMASRQINETVGIYIFSMLMLLTLLPPAHVVSMACNACGPECANACGTAMFRACCFNYNKKRSAPEPEFEHGATDNAANLSEGLDLSPWSNDNSGDITTSQMGSRYQKPFLATKWVHLLGKIPDGAMNKERKQKI